MPSINDVSESKYVRKEDVGQGKIVTVIGYEKKDVSADNEPTEMKYTITFQECKPLVLNKTNAVMFGHLANTNYGITRDLQEDPDDGSMTPANEQFASWIGKQFMLYNDPNVGFAGKITGGIRVRSALPSGGMNAHQQAHYDQNGPPPTDTRDFTDGKPTDELPERL